METPIGGEFIRLVRGNPNKLEGRVICFSRLKDKELIKAGVPSIFTVFATDNFEKYIQRVASNRQEVNYLREMKRRADKEIKENCGGMILGGIYSSQIRLKDESELYNGGEDIVHTGEYSNPLSCAGSIKFGIHLYFFKYDEQNMDSTKIRQKV